LDFSDFDIKVKSMQMASYFHPDRLRINSCGRTNCAPDWAWRTDQQAWTDLDLWVVIQGRGAMETADAQTEIHRGSTWMLRGGASYAGHQDAEDRLLVSHTHFDCIDVDGNVVRWQDIELPNECRPVQNMVAFDSLLLGMWRAHLHTPNSLAARVWLAAALQFVADTDQELQQAENRSELAQAIDELCDNVLHEPRQWENVAAMAAACFCQVDHFTRQFRKQRGKTPSAFLTMARMERARSLLQYTTLSIEQVAKAVGYREAAYMSRVFKSYHGMSPLRWRQKADSS
jgi:AraC-like DNA-binding protein